MFPVKRRHIIQELDLLKAQLHRHQIRYAANKKLFYHWLNRPNVKVCLGIATGIGAWLFIRSHSVQQLSRNALKKVKPHLTLYIKALMTRLLTTLMPV